MSKNQKILHLENNISISYNYVHEWIYANWTGDQTLDSVKAGCELILQSVLSEGCSKVLNDNSNVTNNWLEASEWVALEWFPRMDNAGLKYFAWVFSDNTFSRIAAEETMSFHNTKSIIISFDEIDTAKSWLKTV